MPSPSQELFNAVGPLGSFERALELIAAGGRADFRLAGGGWTTRMQAFAWCPRALAHVRDHPRVHWFDAVIDGDAIDVAARVRDGAPLDEKDVYGTRTALRFAAALGHEDVLVVLLEAGADPNPLPKPWNSPLVDALAGGHLRCADRLWHAGTRADDLLVYVIKERSVHRTRSPDAALAWVCARLDEPIPPQAMRQAITTKHPTAVPWLISAGIDVNARIWTESFLMTAAFYRNAPAVRQLLAAGIDAHAQDGHGRTAMHYALCRDHLQDPEAVFDYAPADLDGEIPRLLLGVGLAVPPPETE